MTRVSSPVGLYRNGLSGMAAVVSLATMLAFGGTAHAVDLISEEPDGTIVMANPLPDPELDRMRGGWRIGGFDLSFGLEIRSTINNIMQIVSLLTVNDVVNNQAIGTITQQVWQTAAGAGDASSAAGGGELLGSTTSGLSDAGAIVAGAVVVSDDATETPTGASVEVVQDVTNGLLTQITNTVNNLSVSQNVVLNVELQNYNQAISVSRTRQMASNIASTIATFRPSR